MLSDTVPILVVLGMVLSGCADSIDTADGDQKPAAEIVLEEVLRLGDETRGDTALFGNIADLAANSMGQIFVAEYNRDFVSVFSAKGKPVAEIGGTGEGPGEFQRISAIFVGSDDSLYVYDLQVYKVSVFEPQTYQLAYTIAIPFDKTDIGVLIPIDLVGVANEGAAMAFLLPYRPAADTDPVGQKDREFQISVVSRQGKVIRPLVTLPQAMNIVTYRGGGVSARSLPFGRRPLRAFGPDKHVYAGWTDSVGISVTDLHGSQIRSIRREHDAVPVTQKDIDALLASLSEASREVILNADLPETKPAFEALVVNDDGRPWIRHSSAAGDTLASWSILNADGTIFANVELPAGTDLEAIHSGKAYGTHSDEKTGAEFVVVYEIGN